MASYFASFCTQLVCSGLSSQFDPEISSVATRQCSWYAVGAAARAAELAAKWGVAEELRRIHSETLADATARKAASPTRAHIETLFHSSILAAHPAVSPTFKVVRWNPEEPDVIEEFFASFEGRSTFPNAAEVQAIKASFPTAAVSELRAELVRLHATPRRAIVFNRSSESFVAIPVERPSATGAPTVKGAAASGAGEAVSDVIAAAPAAAGSASEPEPATAKLFLVLDSHVRECGLMTADQLLNYALKGSKPDVGLLLTYGITAPFE